MNLADMPSEVLINTFEFVNAAAILSRCACVCSTWRRIADEPELWRRLIARRWHELHDGVVQAIDTREIAAPDSDCYDLRDVFFRLAPLPTGLHREQPHIVLSGGVQSAPPTCARFTGPALGGNQTVRASTPWACSPSGVILAGRAPEPMGGAPVGVLRPLPRPTAPSSAGHDGRPGVSASFSAELHACHYFEVTILPAAADQPGRGAGSAWQGRPCVAVGMCTARFPLMGRMPGWDRHSFAYHGDDGCKFQNSSYGERYGPPFGEGDVVGCGVRMLSTHATGAKPPCGQVFFTLNGALLPDPRMLLGHLGHAPLFACIGLDTYTPVRVNFGHEPFVFGLSRLAQWFEGERCEPGGAQALPSAAGAEPAAGVAAVEAPMDAAQLRSWLRSSWRRSEAAEAAGAAGAPAAEGHAPAGPAPVGDGAEADAGGLLGAVLAFNALAAEIGAIPIPIPAGVLNADGGVPAGALPAGLAEALGIAAQHAIGMDSEGDSDFEDDSAELSDDSGTDSGGSAHDDGSREGSEAGPGAVPMEADEPEPAGE